MTLKEILETLKNGPDPRAAIYLLTMSERSIWYAAEKLEWSFKKICPWEGKILEDRPLKLARAVAKYGWFVDTVIAQKKLGYDRSDNDVETVVNRISSLTVSLPVEDIKRAISPVAIIDPSLYQKAVERLLKVEEWIRYIPCLNALISLSRKYRRLKFGDRVRLFAGALRSVRTVGDILTLLIGAGVLRLKYLIGYLKVDPLRSVQFLNGIEPEMGEPVIKNTGTCPILPDVIRVLSAVVNMDDEERRKEIIVSCLGALGFRWIPELIKTFPEIKSMWPVLREDTDFGWFRKAVITYGNLLMNTGRQGDVNDYIRWLFDEWVTSDPAHASKEILRAAKKNPWGPAAIFAAVSGEDIRDPGFVMYGLGYIADFNARGTERKKTEHPGGLFSAENDDKNERR
jgi:hypothetical protein